MSTIQNPNGWDVIFSPNSDGSAPYDHEIEPGAPNFAVIGEVRTTGDVVVQVTAHPYLTGSVVFYRSSGLVTSGSFTVTYIDTDHFSLDSTPGSAGTNSGGAVCGIYDAATGNVAFWIRIPILSSSTDSVLYMLYNKSGVTSTPENVSAVWPSPSTAIYHVPRGDPFDSTPFFSPDSTGNFPAFTGGGGLTQATGQVQKGLATGGLFHIENDTFPDLPSGSYSVSCWQFIATASSGSFQSFLDLQTTGGGGQVGFGIKPGGNPYLVTHGVFEYDFTSLTAPYNKWFHVSYSVSLTATTCNLFNPGVGYTSQSQATTPKSGVVGKLIGFEDLDTNCFADELNLYADLISSGRFQTLATNQSDATFITIGSEGPGSAGYTYQRTITINHAKVFGGDQTNFPLVINEVLPVNPIPTQIPEVLSFPTSTGTGILKTVEKTSFTVSGGSAAYTSGPPTPPVTPSRRCTPIINPTTVGSSGSSGGVS